MLILNEKKYAEDLYLGKNNDVKSVVAKVGYVTRYQLYVLGYNDDDNYSCTVGWMNKYHNNFDESCYSNLIASAVKKAHKRPFFNVGSIKITKSELDTISSLDNLRAEKVLFVLLCMAKQQHVIYSFTNGLVRYSISDLCKTARISVPTEEREYILYYIMKNGYLEYPKKNDTKCLMVNFMNDDSDVVLDLDENMCRELAYEYMSWKNSGNGYFHCELCGKAGKQQKSSPRRFCKECLDIVGDVPDDMKVVRCSNDSCDTIFYVDKRNMTKCRCDDCQKQRDKETKSIRNAKYYDKHKN